MKITAAVVLMYAGHFAVMCGSNFETAPIQDQEWSGMQSATCFLYYTCSYLAGTIRLQALRPGTIDRANLVILEGMQGYFRKKSARPSTNRKYLGCNGLFP
jgi:hypothetical protein